jgi:hypothetical protein
MLLRFVPLAIVVFWLAAMGWLVHHDVIPRWTAQDAPKFTQGEWLTDRIRSSQARIENAYGHKVGAVWTVYEPAVNRLSRTDCLMLTGLPLLPPVRIVADSDFTSNGVLDEFHLIAAGMGHQVMLDGEQYGDQFAFQLKIGPRPFQYFKIDTQVSSMLGDALHPFSALPFLEVGQSWRMHVINPMAIVTGVGAKTLPMIVQVTGRETIDHDGVGVECFVVQADQVKAYVNDEGLVLHQELESPWGGKFTVIDEPFDRAEYERALSVSLR